MPALAAPALVAAALLALAGAQKVVDPTMTVGALRALRLPASPVLVRLGSAAELGLAVAAVTVGGAVVWSLVALSYLGFAAFVLAARRAGTMIGSCGCFGRDETPPHPIHVVLDLGLAAVAAATALTTPTPLIEELVAQPAEGAAIAAASAVALYLLYAAFVELPRTLSLRRA